MAQANHLMAEQEEEAHPQQANHLMAGRRLQVPANRRMEEHHMVVEHLTMGEPNRQQQEDMVSQLHPIHLLDMGEEDILQRVVAHRLLAIPLALAAMAEPQRAVMVDPQRADIQREGHLAAMVAMAEPRRADIQRAERQWEDPLHTAVIQRVERHQWEVLLHTEALQVTKADTPLVLLLAILPRKHVHKQ
jgi:hypothetical protein